MTRVPPTSASLAANAASTAASIAFCHTVPAGPASPAVGEQAVKTNIKAIKITVIFFFISTFFFD